MQIRNTTGTYSVADRNPDMMEPKDPVSVKSITTKRHNGGSYWMRLPKQYIISQRGLYGYRGHNEED
jgi:hypothetical protein